MQNQPVNARPGQRAYTNVVLTAIAGLLGIIAVGQQQGGLATSAQAQPQTFAQAPDEPTTGMVGAADQRKQMINELKSISGRLDRIESALNRGISVKVTELPAGALTDRKDEKDKGQK